MDFESEEVRLEFHTLPADVQLEIDRFAEEVAKFGLFLGIVSVSPELTLRLKVAKSPRPLTAV